jgi:ATP-binding cassette subfamily C exporter for protease/lipase
MSTSITTATPQRAQILEILLGFRREVLWVGIFSFVANLLSLSPTLYMLQLFDRVILSQNEYSLIVFTMIITLFIGVMSFAEWIRSRLLVRAGVRFDESLNSRIFLSQFDTMLRNPSVATGNAFGSLTRLRQFLTGNGLIAAFDLPWMPIYLAVLFFMHPLLGYFGISFTVFLALLMMTANGYTAVPLKHAQTAESKTTAYIAGKLRNAEVVEAMGMSGNFRQQWLQLYAQQARVSAEAFNQSSKWSSITKFVQYSQQSIILALGAWLVIRGEMSPGAMIASNVLMGNALRPIGVIVMTWKEFVQARQSYEEIDGMLESYVQQDTSRTAHHRADLVNGVIKVENLSAYVDQRTQAILDKLNFQVESGETIAIVGASGAGKSTLARCLLGIWPRTSGTVAIDGVDVHRWSRDVLGKNIGYLPQEIELIEGSVADNIGRFGAVDSDAIIDAARRADIHEMILRLPEGYDTPIGQAGKLLSGGQRQRLALARAVYGMPAIVVLDEPNAHLDDAGERALVNVVQSLKSANRTVFMVLHQQHLLALADRVFVLDKGRLVRID